jgi:hypothetical protein
MSVDDDLLGGEEMVVALLPSEASEATAAKLNQ